MKYESVRNQALLNNPTPCAASARATAEPEIMGDLWRHARVWWARMLRFRLRQPRHLRLCESLPLGERRFVAVVEFEHSRFLLGGTTASLVLLARLGKAPGEMQEETQSGNETQSPDRPARISGESHH